MSTSSGASHFSSITRATSTSGRQSPYDWRWENEWRVRGDYEFLDTDISSLVAPKEDHAIVREMWLWEVLDAGEGLVPPLVDVAWPTVRQDLALRDGPQCVTSGDGKQWSGVQASDWISDDDEAIDTAPDRGPWADETALDRADAEQEWSHWLDVMERDDI